MQENKKPENSPEDPDKSMTISELARRHLYDPTHVITDEDLKNARVELTTLHEETSSDTTTDEGEGEKKEHVVPEKTPGTPPNPYDVLE